jgi:hypothetical protein
MEQVVKASAHGKGSPIGGKAQLNARSPSSFKFDSYLSAKSISLPLVPDVG